jgi:hypothetical protein
MHSGVIDTSVKCTAVSMTPLCKYDTAVTLDLIFEWVRLHLKGIYIEKTAIDILTYTISITTLCLVIDSAVTKIGDFIVYFLHEFEAILKKVLTPVSGA